MAIADIEQVCQGLCELTGLTPPRLEPDEQGTRGFTMAIRGVEVALQQFTDRHPDTVFLATVLGDLPEGRELAAWQVLMDANLRLLAPSAPLFTRSPLSGRPVMLWACPLEDATVAGMYQRLLAIADATNRWRKDHFLDDPDAAFSWFVQEFGPGAPSAEERALAHDGFDELCRCVCRELGQPPQIPPAGGVRGFPLQFDRGELRVVQSVDESRELAFMLAAIEPTDADSALADAGELMELNFHLATGSRAIRIAREPVNGKVLLVHGFPLAEATPQEMLATAAVLAGLLDRAPLAAADSIRTNASSS